MYCIGAGSEAVAATTIEYVLFPPQATGKNKYVFCTLSIQCRAETLSKWEPELTALRLRARVKKRKAKS